MWRHATQVQRVRKLYIEKAIFGTNFSANPKNRFCITRIPIGCRQRLRRMIGRIPKEVVCFVLYFGWVNFKKLPVMNLNQQEAIAHLEKQRIAFLTCLIDTPDFHWSVINPEQHVIDYLPGDGLVFGECPSARGAHCPDRRQPH